MVELVCSAIGLFFTMPCDATGTDLRRRKWERVNKCNAPCLAQRGFLLDGTMARQYWFEFDQQQSGGIWDFLNGGRVLDNVDPPIPPNTGQFIWDQGFGNPKVRLDYEGFNEQQVGAEAWTVEVTVSLIQTWPDIDNPVMIYQGVIQDFAPKNNDAWPFASVVQITGQPPAAPLVGGVTAVPLDCCNECTNPT